MNKNANPDSGAAEGDVRTVDPISQNTYGLDQYWGFLERKLRVEHPSFPEPHEAGLLSTAYGPLLGLYGEKSRVVELAPCTLPLAVHAKENGPVRLQVNRVKYYCPQPSASERLGFDPSHGIPPVADFAYGLHTLLHDQLLSGFAAAGIKQDKTRSHRTTDGRAFPSFHGHLNVPVSGTLKVTYDYIRLGATLTIDSVCLSEFPEVGSDIFYPGVFQDKCHTVWRAQNLIPDMTPTVRLPADLKHLSVHTQDKYGVHWTIECDKLLTE